MRCSESSEETLSTAPSGEASPGSQAKFAGAARNARNVRVMYAFTSFSAVAQAVSQGPVLDQFLYRVSGEYNAYVGIGNSIWGLTSLLVAIPVGCAVDTFDRTKILKVGSVLGVVAAGVMMSAVVTGSLGVLYVAFVLWGLYFELASSAAEAVFADSVPAGSRSLLFTRKAMILTLSMALGPGLTLLGLTLGWHNGDDWDPGVVRAILIAGNALLLPACAVMWCFQAPSLGAAGDPAGGLGAVEPPSLVHTTPAAWGGWLKPAYVPYFVAVSDFIVCIGAGMTVKFFNLFFINDYHFTNVQINLLNCVYPLSIALCMRIVQRISSCIGRAQASALAFLLNAVCFCLLSRMNNLRVLLGLFLVRGGLANGAIPIDRSIVMDFVPSADRGKWNAVESFTSMTWCGSAFLGGYLADAHDYRFTFVISAVLYFASLAAYLPLLWLVPRGSDRRSPPLLGAESPGLRSPTLGFAGAVPYAAGPLDRDGGLGVSLQQQPSP